MAHDNESASARVMAMMDGVIVAQLVHVVAELGVADQVQGSPVPVEDLAASTGTDPDALYRSLRLLASQGVFTEASPRAFAATALSDVLRADHPDSVQHIARMRGGSEHWHTWAALEHSLRTGCSAFRHVHGTDLWSFLETHPESGERFDQAMGALAEEIHAATADAHDYSKVRRVIDVGGGWGYLAAELLRRHPDLRAVVFDLEATVRGAEEVLTASGVRERAEVVAGDFFATVPVGGDHYVLSRILHDWDDSAALRILRAVRAAMPVGAELLVVDAVVPDGDVAHPAKAADIIMLALNEGRERTETEFVALLEAAGLRHHCTVGTAGPVSVIVARAA